MKRTDENFRDSFCFLFIFDELAIDDVSLMRMFSSYFEFSLGDSF